MHLLSKFGYFDFPHPLCPLPLGKSTRGKTELGVEKRTEVLKGGSVAPSVGDSVLGGSLIIYFRASPESR